MLKNETAAAVGGGSAAPVAVAAALGIGAISAAAVIAKKVRAKRAENAPTEKSGKIKSKEIKSKTDYEKEQKSGKIKDPTLNKIWKAEKESYPNVLFGDIIKKYKKQAQMATTFSEVNKIENAVRKEIEKKSRSLENELKNKGLYNDATAEVLNNHTALATTFDDIEYFYDTFSLPRNRKIDFHK